MGMGGGVGGMRWVYASFGRQVNLRPTKAPSPTFVGLGPAAGALLLAPAVASASLPARLAVIGASKANTAIYLDLD